MPTDRIGLKLRRDNDAADLFQVYSGTVRIGTIMRAPNLTRETWTWSLNGLMTGPPGWSANGHAADFEGAKTNLKTNWEAWLQAAGLRGSCGG